MSVGTFVEDLARHAVFVLYYCCSLTTSTFILFYASFLGHAHPFNKRVRSVLSAVTCAPWLLCAGVRLAIQNETLLAARGEIRRTINVGTHASHIDGLSMMVLYWRNRYVIGPPCAVVKREVLLTPFYGPFAYLVGNIFVARGSTKEAAVKSMRTVGQRIKDGYMIGAFPEGTRRRSPSCGRDHLLPFKKGTFHMVKNLFDEGVDITISPFCLVGSRTAWPRGRLLPLPRSKVLIKFCEHVNISKEDTPESLLARTRERIENGIDEAAKIDGKYDIENAFEKGVEVDLFREFSLEAILLVLPPLVTVYLACVGLL